MSNKTNDEKLNILRERLAQIQQKQDNLIVQKKYEKDSSSHESHQEKIYNSNKKSSKRIKYLILILFIGFISFYLYNNLNINLLDNKISSQIEEKKDEEKEFILKYNLNLKGKYIAIINSFDNESSAKALVNDLKVKGYNTNYLFLPEKSNSKQELYQVFIGPYENMQETSQWVQNINKEVSIINITEGTVIKKMKSKILIAKEKAENERIAREKAENERIAKEIAQQRAENERIAREKAENERIAREKEKQKIKQEEEKEQLEQDELNKEKEKINLERIQLLNEKAQLEEERIQLEKDKQNLLTKKKDQKRTIIVRYIYKFYPTIENEGFLIITNNAGYPTIKQNFENISDQGGIENIIDKIESEIDTFGILIEDIYFEKTGNPTPIYDGKIKEVIL